MNSLYLWTDEEIARIAEEVRIRITGGKAQIITDYLALAENKKISDLGLLDLWILKNDSRASFYFPREVLEVLKKKIGNRLRDPSEVNDFILEHRAKGSKWLAGHLYLTREGIRERASDAGISIPPRHLRQYTAEEDERLKSADLEKTGDEELARQLGRNSDSIAYRRRVKLGILRQEHFFWEGSIEDVILRKLYYVSNTRRIAEVLGKSHKSVRGRIFYLLKTDRLEQRSNYSEYAETIKKLYGKIPLDELCRMLGKTREQIITKAYWLRKKGELRIKYGVEY